MCKIEQQLGFATFVVIDDENATVDPARYKNRLVDEEAAGGLWNLSVGEEHKTAIAEASGFPPPTFITRILRNTSSSTGLHYRNSKEYWSFYFLCAFKTEERSSRRAPFACNIQSRLNRSERSRAQDFLLCAYEKSKEFKAKQECKTCTPSYDQTREIGDLSCICMGSIEQKCLGGVECLICIGLKASSIGREHICMPSAELLETYFSAVILEACGNPKNRFFFLLSYLRCRSSLIVIILSITNAAFITALPNVAFSATLCHRNIESQRIKTPYNSQQFSDTDRISEDSDPLWLPTDKI
ncbi:hypothetical protein IEQ34_009476 [Dendrobium chrysotoxum]|uniref:Uncharacterized protein n=1 Tax=Dendrobium chrysotoxum TaxID=161865 RepID=A0AAV7H0I0_DENCH|nr:hypothetical protein IEQ34_009476 [Dendrobium chrysotoxum]